MSLDRVIDFYTSSLTGFHYGLLAAVCASTVFALVWRFVPPARPAIAADGVSATELAYLRSDSAPVVTALAGLRASGRIAADGRVDPCVPAGPESDWFTERVFQRVAAKPEHTVRSLIAASRGDLPILEKRLCDRGLMRAAAERARIRWGAAPALVAVAMGIAFCLYQAMHLPGRHNTGSIAMLMLFLLPYSAAVLPFLFSVDRRTRAGRKALKAQQRRLRYLRPDQRPAFATYGPAAVAMSAALFGPAALWVIDSDYATAVELNGDGDGGGDGGGCGASCGGDGGGGGGGGGCGGCGGGGGGGGGE